MLTKVSLGPHRAAASSPQRIRGLASGRLKVVSYGRTHPLRLPGNQSALDPRLLPLGSGPALRLDFYILCRPAQSQHVVVSPAVVSDPGPGDKAQWTFWGEEGCEHWSKCCRGQSIESCLTTRG